LPRALNRPILLIAARSRDPRQGCVTPDAEVHLSSPQHDLASLSGVGPLTDTDGAWSAPRPQVSRRAPSLTGGRDLERFRSSASILFVSVVCLGAGAAGVVASSARGALASPTAQSADRTTIIYNAAGRRVGSIVGNYKYGWNRGSSGECWVSPRQSKSGTIFYAGLTHSAFGGAVPAGHGRWKVWYEGTIFSGIIVLRTSVRADLYGRSGKRVGYTVGPDPVAAGAAFLILDREGCTN
jgi:hypothetical protein